MPELTRDLITREDRPLSEKETELVRWLLEQGRQGSDSFLPQVGRLSVVSRCGCGCASVDFSLDRIPADRKISLNPVSDWFWGESGKDLCGVFVFIREGKVSGLEVWSVDGSVTPTELPQIVDLRESP